MSTVVEAAGWRMTSLGEVVELKRGYDLPQRDRIPGSVPLVSSSGVTDHHAEAKVKGPGVVTGRYGTLGKVFYVEEDFWPLNTTLYVRDFKGNDPRFISYLLRTLDFFAYSDKAAVPGLNRNHLHQEIVRIPPLLVQRAIAHVLGTLDDKIELNRRMNETLEAMARALFRSWFVNFEPVRAKVEGRWRPGESLPGLPAHLHPLFPDRLVPSELGDIPEGWEVGTVEDVIEVNPRRTIRRGEMATHVEMAALPTSGPDVESWTQRNFTSGSRFKKGDTLLARITPSLENGKTALVDFLDDSETGWGSTEFIVLYPKPPWPPEFAYLLARDASFREHAIVNMTGTSGRQRVPAEAVASYTIAAPSDDVGVAFGSLVRPLFESASSASRQSRGIAAQRDTLLPRLVSGTLRVEANEMPMGLGPANR